MKDIMKTWRIGLGVLAVLALGALVLALWMLWRPTPLAPSILEANGRIEGDQAAVGAKIAGKLVRLTVREGDGLESWALIAELAPEGSAPELLALSVFV
jgi:HlyD family secretion protein